jgi:hypothetical protein
MNFEFFPDELIIVFSNLYREKRFHGLVRRFGRPSYVSSVRRTSLGGSSVLLGRLIKSSVSSMQIEESGSRTL